MDRRIYEKESQVNLKVEFDRQWDGWIINVRHFNLSVDLLSNEK